MGYEIDWTSPGIGCVTVVPGALVGFAGLADGGGPGGWRGWAELVGWLAISLAAILLFAALCRRMRCPGGRGGRAACLLIAAIALFTFIPHYIGLFAPMWLKVTFTTTLQVLGSSAVVLLMAGGSYMAWRQLRDR